MGRPTLELVSSIMGGASIPILGSSGARQRFRMPLTQSAVRLIFLLSRYPPPLTTHAVALHPHPFPPSAAPFRDNFIIAKPPPPLRGLLLTLRNR